MHSYTNDIRSIADLEAYLVAKGLSWQQAHLPEELKSTTNGTVSNSHFVLRIPKFYAELIKWNDVNDPLKKMVIPSKDEQKAASYELSDPIGDHTHEPVPGLVHRYPDRCLLLLTTHCSVHCRFCFRRDVIGTPLPVDMAGIVTYLQDQTDIKEIILTGGDPATLPAGFLGALIDRIGQISHINRWRFHSRSMVVDPTIIDDKWLDQLDRLETQQKIVVLHINHQREITPELAELVKKLRQRQVLVLSQSVLLKDINDSFDELSKLFVGLSNIGVKPYYLHHLDKAQGTDHFRVSIEAGKKLYTQLRGKISGYNVPEYVVDLPGGDGKVPVMWLERQADGNYQVENFEGKTITYNDPLGETS